MLVLGSRVIDTAVMSLQTGTRLAKTKAALIDPTNLKVYAYLLEGPLLTEQPSFLRTQDVREIGSIGMIVDSSDEFVGKDDIIKIQELLSIDFPLINMPVIDDTGHRLGKVEDYTIETGSFMIEQLNIKRGLIKGITDAGLLIHRSQIVEVNDHRIIVKSNVKKIGPVMQTVRNEFVNPFRPRSPQPEQRKAD